MFLFQVKKEDIKVEAKREEDTVKKEVGDTGDKKVNGETGDAVEGGDSKDNKDESKAPAVKVIIRQRQNFKVFALYVCKR